MSDPFVPPHARALPPGVELLASQELHRGRVFALRHDELRLPSGLEQKLDVVEHGGAVCVAAVDEDGRMLLVRQYRHAARAWLEEIPAGRLEPGESDPLLAAQRELEEETGMRAQSWSPLRSFLAAPGFCSEVLHLYLAEGLASAGPDARSADPDEEIEVVRRTPVEVLASEAGDAKTLLAAALLLREAR